MGIATSLQQISQQEFQGTGIQTILFWEKNEFISGKLDMINNKDIAQGLYLHFIQNIDSSSGCSLDEIFG